MWKRELLRNKIVAVTLVVAGVLMTLSGNDATVLVVTLMIGVPMFFAKENWIF